MKSNLKYNNKKTNTGELKFDSEDEANFYHRLLEKKIMGEILDIELQPKYMLQEAFEKDGVKHKPIYYIADFLVTYKDGKQVVMDFKGMVSEYSKLKHKLFDKNYALPLEIWVVFPKKYGGGFGLLKDLNKMKSAEKKQKKRLEEEITYRKKYEAFLLSAARSGESVEGQTFEKFVKEYKKIEKIRVYSNKGGE